MPHDHAQRRLLFSVQAHASRISSLRVALTDAVRDELSAEETTRRRLELHGAAIQVRHAAALAVSAGATVEDLTGYGLTASAAADILRGADHSRLCDHCQRRGADELTACPECDEELWLHAGCRDAWLADGECTYTQLEEEHNA